MSYIADIETVRTNGNGRSHFGESKECVAAVKYFTGAPQTALWRKGTAVKGNLNLKAGTAIATFDDKGKYKGHAAIYDSQNSAGLNVYDQWNSQEFHPRLIRFGGRGVSNDVDQFYVIE